MTKNTIIAAAMAFAAVGASAADNEKMYLVKDNHVVAKYDVDAVDYISFNLPDDVKDGSLWLDVNKVGKNTVTYTVNTSGKDVAYAHNLISYYEANYVAMDYFNTRLEELDEADATLCIQYALSGNAFVGVGKATYTQTDFDQYDNTSESNRFSVTPGTKYYLCAWQVDPETTEPLEYFVFTELTTEKPEAVNLDLNVTNGKFNDYGMVLDFTGSDEIKYVRTVWGMKKSMESYVKVSGRDFLMGTFGQSWSMSFLAGSGDLVPDVENATWPVFDPGEYIMYVNAYDAAGNVEEKEFVFEYVSSEDEDVPVVTVFSKEKSEGHVKVNFEITPSNVEEAYVRMLSENTVDDRINMGYTYPEIAMGGDATDITTDINTMGEYTFESNEVEEQWTSILIYAKLKDGGVTTLRINFWPDTESEWSIYAPFHAPKQRKMPKINSIKRAGVPVISRNVK